MGDCERSGPGKSRTRPWRAAQRQASPVLELTGTASKSGRHGLEAQFVQGQRPFPYPKRIELAVSELMLTPTSTTSLVPGEPVMVITVSAPTWLTV